MAPFTPLVENHDELYLHISDNTIFHIRHTRTGAKYTPNVVSSDHPPCIPSATAECWSVLDNLSQPELTWLNLLVSSRGKRYSPLCGIGASTYLPRSCYKS